MRSDQGDGFGMFEWLLGKRRPTADGTSKSNNIAPADVLNLVQSGAKVTILDVREQQEFRAGHIKGAQLIPLGQLGKRTHEIRDDRPVITVCRSGNRSAQAARLLRSKGFDVQNMSGGMSQWPGKVAK